MIRRLWSCSRLGLESQPLSPNRASGRWRGWSAGAACDGWDAVDQGEGLGDVVDVGRRRDDFWQGAVTVADQAVLATHFRRSTGDGPVSAPPLLARIWEPSTHTRDQSSSPAAFISASRIPGTLGPDQAAIDDIRAIVERNGWEHDVIWYP
jgi:hypothetical protein